MLQNNRIFIGIIMLIFSSQFAFSQAAFDYEKHFEQEISKIQIKLEDPLLSDMKKSAYQRRIVILEKLRNRYREENGLPESEMLIARNLDYEELSREEKLTILNNQLENGLISNENYEAAIRDLD